MKKLYNNGDLSNADLLFRTIILVNQLNVYGAIADWCGELTQQILDHSEIELPAQKNLLRFHNKRSKNIPKGIKVILQTKQLVS